MEVSGDHYLRPLAPGAYIGRFVKDGQQLQRGASGTLPGARQTGWRAFLLTGEGDTAACVELQRSLREHVEGGLGHYSQAIVTGVYCRAGAAQIGPEEAGEIAAGLST